MAKVILSDGTVIDNLTMNGNNFVSKRPITAEMFDGKLSEVQMVYENEDGIEVTETINDAKLIQIDTKHGGWWFILAETPANEKAAMLIDETLKKNSTSITDLEMALVEVYELLG